MMDDIDSRIDWVDFYRARLQDAPRPAGDNKYHACCPFHKEDNPSFWFNTKNGLWKCEAGCGSGNATSFLARLEGISNQEAFAKLRDLAGVAPSTAPKTSKKDLPRLPLTLAEYAASKHMSAEKLEKLGLAEATDNHGVACVAIPYFDANGTRIATKLRYHPDGQRFSYLPGGQTALYGLWLKFNRDADDIILVEGESDAQALWINGFPAYGVPGAGNFRKEWAKLLRSKRVFLHRENDNGGEYFIAKTCKALTDGGFTGETRVFAAADILPGAKDPCDLYTLLSSDDFKTKLRAALDSAPLLDAASTMTVKDAVPTAPKNRINPIETYSAADLYGKHLERPPVIVQSMVPAGLTVLAGAPKRGKSWLALQMGISVAAGDPFLGMQTAPGDVLYLDLESRQYRVQSRLAALLPGRAPERLHIAHEAASLDGGLTEQLDMWCESVKNPSLIIVDTLGRVKGRAQRGENAYEGDTRILGGLQSFALKRKIAVVCVHHLRKSMPDGDDFFERISGSMGITGACDMVIALCGKRDEPDNVILKTGGRDFEPLDLVLGFDRGIWSLRSANSEQYRAEREYMNNDIIRAVIRFAEDIKSWQGTPAHLMERLCELGSFDINTSPAYMMRDHLMPNAQMLHDRDGIIISQRRSGKRGRIVTIKKVDQYGF